MISVDLLNDLMSYFNLKKLAKQMNLTCRGHWASLRLDRCYLIRVMEMRKCLLMFVLMSFATLSHAGLIELEATDAGWYNDQGLHQSNNTNYLVGHLNGFPNDFSFKNFLVFDLSSINGDITSATLELFTYDIVGALTYNIYDTLTPVDILTTGGTGLVNIYNELGSGTYWGGIDLSENQSNQTIQIQLNNTALTKLNGLDNSFALGGSYETTNSNTNYAFGVSGNLSIAKLILDVSPLAVPQPNALILLCLGLLSLWHSRQKGIRHRI